MAHTLLIWEEIPENTSLYFIPNEKITEHARGVLAGANGTYLNCSENTCTEELNENLSSYEEYKKSPTEGPFILDVTHVYHSGFVL